MKVELINGNLVITIPATTENPAPSASGKTLIVATTSGNIKTTVLVKGRPLTVGLNAYIPNR